MAFPAPTQFFLLPLILTIQRMWLNLSAIFRRLSHDPNVRSIIMTGAGDRAFTAGLDVKVRRLRTLCFYLRNRLIFSLKAASQGTLSQSSADPARAATALRRHIFEFQDCITALEKCEKPIIVVLHGTSYGLAIDLSLACDIRICAVDTRFSVKEVDIGLAADIGTLSRLPKSIGNFSWVKDVCLSARVFDAEEAKKVGLVSGVYGNKEKAVSQVQFAPSRASLISFNTHWVGLAQLY